MYLTQDIRSNINDSLHGAKGSEVTVISAMEDHLNVVIVQDKGGKRFPVNVKYLQKEKVNPNPVKDNPEPVKVKKKVNAKLF